MQHAAPSVHVDAGFQHFQPVVAEPVVQLGRVCNAEDAVEADVVADHRAVGSEGRDHADTFYTI